MTTITIIVYTISFFYTIFNFIKLNTIIRDKTIFNIIIQSLNVSSSSPFTKSPVDCSIGSVILILSIISYFIININNNN